MSSVVEFPPRSPSPSITDTLDALDDLLRGLMALAENNDDASDLAACHALARRAIELSEKVRELCGDRRE
jgi:hypothetical protein